MSPNNKPEILAPAGSWAGLRAALDAGCDAVYFGLKGSNMRAGADNFTPAALDKLTGMCRTAGARAYLALNTIIYEHELEKVRRLLHRAHAAGVDGVICWDLAVLQEARQAGLPAHVSTQMSIANSQSLLLLHRQFDVRRFVLARECSLSDIRKIRRALARHLGPEAAAIELEVFAHGAMCVSLSGRCFLSQFQYGTSANRGRCYQPCRRQYHIRATDDAVEFTLGTGYILSPKDLCTLPFIEKLLAAGIGCLKIEGRNRSPEYVSTVTSAYRRAVDFYYDNRGRRGFPAAFAALKQQLLQELDRVYHRGLSSGFFLGKPIDQWAAGPGSQAATRKTHIGVVTKYYRHPGVAEIKIESTAFRQGDEIMFQGPTTGTFSQVAGSIQVNHQNVQLAHKGTTVAVKTDRLTRKNDAVYLLQATRHKASH